MKEFWDERFGNEEYIYGVKPNEYFKSKLDKLKIGKLLLPAEGEGRNALYAAKNGWEVEAFDYSAEGRKKALALAEKNDLSIDYNLMDLVEGKLEVNKYDAAAIIFLHFPPHERKMVHKKIFNSLKNGGYLIAELFSKEQIEFGTGGPKNIDMLYEIEQIIEDLQGFEFIEIEKKIIEFDEGPHHSGKASVIRVFARKGN